VLFEEGQSRRSVVEGPGTGVATIAVALGGEEVIGPVEETGVDAEAVAGELVVRGPVSEPDCELGCGGAVVELALWFSASFLCLDARLAPTPPPTAAPMTTRTTITARSTQKVLAAKPQIVRFGVCRSSASLEASGTDDGKMCPVSYPVSSPVSWCSSPE
jgi:hypothetical protein